MIKPEQMSAQRNDIKTTHSKLCLLGASLDTGNLGVTALCVSCLQGLNEEFPEAHITLLDYGGRNRSRTVRIGDKKISVEMLNMDFSKKIWSANHILRLLAVAFFLKLPVNAAFKKKVLQSNVYLAALSSCDVVAAISAGDSFSDIYGLKRLLYVCLPQILAIAVGARLILLPQTFGPFRKRISRMPARYIVKHSNLICSRDRHGKNELEKLVGNLQLDGKLCLCPDAAFILSPSEPAIIDADLLRAKLTADSIIAGLNVSGLLFNGGYSRGDMFKLQVDYRQLLYSIIERLMAYKNVTVVLVPHVFTPHRSIESDVDACLTVYDETAGRYPGRILLIKQNYDQSQVKYIIGLCDLFIGSRMHSCIAALSQNIPCVGLAYSRKFQGVFQTVDAENFVVDMRDTAEKQALETIENALQQRNVISKHLKTITSRVRDRVYSLFGSLI